MADPAKQPQPVPPNNLRPISRLITTHSPTGHAVFSTALPEPIAPIQTTIQNGDKFALSYATAKTPANFNSDQDLATYQSLLASPPGIVIPGGSVLRIVDVRPGGESPMHRTVSLDYGVVLDGEVEIALDSGETRVMKRGDHCVQRGTMHAWRNRSETEWARMLFVLLEAERVVVKGGRALGEDYGEGMADIKPSGN
ncbi:cupin domain-containing protein [Podospora appendiculata]|uniref:Cupin domain-containing protein n=1 Tax=Podospora appendiculata TaxID=314037 RepID=A0AAE0XJG8_9PEZI|nr:cupin domain-containing protein [Podospora appendiculata]